MTAKQKAGEPAPGVQRPSAAKNRPPAAGAHASAARIAPPTPTQSHRLPAPSRPAPEQAAGNQASQRLAELSRRVGAQPALPASVASAPIQFRMLVNQPGTPAEQEADRAAARLHSRPLPGAQNSAPNTPGEAAPPIAINQKAGDPRAMDQLATNVQMEIKRMLAAAHERGQPLDAQARARLEGLFGEDLSSVRVHDNPLAAEIARMLEAAAFAYGTDIYFGAGQYQPGTSQGQALLAHELAHVVQQMDQPRPGPIQRQPRGGLPGPNDAVSDAPPFVDSATLIIPGEYDVPVEVEDPDLDKKKPKKQTIVVHTPKQKEEHFHYYVVPLTKLQGYKPPPPPPPAATNQPPAAPPPAATGFNPSGNADYPVGTTVKALDGTQLEVLASTPEHIITASYTKFAVGAASTSALVLMDGTIIVIDAGVNNQGMGMSKKALTELILQKLDKFIHESTSGDPVIREILISHTHGDHASMAPDIILRFPVDTIRLNDIQKRYGGYRALRKQIVDNLKKFRSEREKTLRESLEKERLTWEKDQPYVADEGARQKRWEKYTAEEVQRRLADLPVTRERVLIQSKGGKLDVAEIDIATGKEQERRAFSEEDPLAIYETQREVTDPTLLDRRRNTKKSAIDPNASVYIVALKGGMRFLVLPDLRANDLDALVDRFKTEMSKIKQEATVQVWDASHHMQKGWYHGEVPATQLLKIVDFLYTFRSQKGTDILVVSAQADLANAKAKTLIDPVNLWLLRGLGFEAYLATSGQDVNVFEFETSQGQKLTGVASPKAPGHRPGDLSIRRAKGGLEQLRADRQTQQAAKRDETQPDKLKAIEENVKEIDAKISEVEGALKKYVEAGHKELNAKKHTTQSITPDPNAPEPALAERLALDKILEKYHFDKPVTTDLHLTDMALVILRKDTLAGPFPEGSPQARALRLKELRSQINEIGLRIRAGETSPEVQFELYSKLTEYQKALESELKPGDPAQKLPEGVSEKLLRDELTSIKEKIKTIAPEEGKVDVQRVAGTKEIIEQRAVRVTSLPEPPSKATRLTGQALEVAGKGMGAVMVIFSVSGQGDLQRRWETGRATNAEMAFGTGHNILNAGVGFKMARGIPVSNGVFVVIALLDVGQAVFRHYESDEQRNTEIAYAVISNAINLGLIAVGQTLMKIPHPVAMIAGFLITFAGPVILEALGVHDWLERRMSFNPSDVVQVYQTLRKLVQDYSVIVGSILLADRNASELTSLAVTDPQAFREQARITARDYRIKAIPLERKILSEFKEAYDDAKGNYAGLKELDQYREQFLTLQHQANPNGEEVTAWNEVYGEERRREREETRKAMEQWNKHPSGQGVPPSSFLALKEMQNPEPEPTRKLIEQTFQNIEANMSLDSMSDEDIRDMKQWSKLDDIFNDMWDEIKKESYKIDHEDVQKMDKKAEAMISNARYRLYPERQGELRTKALFTDGSRARKTYESILSEKERSLTFVHQAYIEKTLSVSKPQLDAVVAPDPRTQPYTIHSYALTDLEGVIARYKITIESMPAPPEKMVENMYYSSIGVNEYKNYIETNPDYAQRLSNLETSERMIESMVESVWRMVKPPSAAAGVNTSQPEQGPPSPETDADIEKKRLEGMLKLKDEAKKKARYRGIIFTSELDSFKNEVKAEEIDDLAAALGARQDAKPLSKEELETLKTKGFKDQAASIRMPVTNRLWAIPELSRRDEKGNLVNIRRFVGNIPSYSVDGTEPRVQGAVDADRNVIVGVTGPGERYSPSWDTPGPMTVRVIPLNQRADDVFGQFARWDVYPDELQPVTMEELKLGQSAPPPIPAPVLDIPAPGANQLAGVPA